MAKKKTKDLTWSEIGEAIGRKIEKEQKDKPPFFWKRWDFHHHEHGGGFGRFLFVIGVLLVLDHIGTIVLNNIPLWILALIVIGFTAMRF